MDPKSSQALNFKKITLSVEAGSTPDDMDLTDDSTEFSFIYGIGTTGLSPFEFQVANRSQGDEFSLQIHRSRLHSIFQHIAVPIADIPSHLESFYLKFVMIRVAPAENREVISALAEISECGSHCCGCGH